MKVNKADIEYLVDKYMEWKEYFDSRYDNGEKPAMDSKATSIWGEFFDFSKDKYGWSFTLLIKELVEYMAEKNLSVENVLNAIEAMGVEVE